MNAILIIYSLSLQTRLHQVVVQTRASVAESVLKRAVLYHVYAVQDSLDNSVKHKVSKKKTIYWYPDTFTEQFFNPKLKVSVAFKVLENIMHI